MSLLVVADYREQVAACWEAARPGRQRSDRSAPVAPSSPRSQGLLSRARRLRAALKSCADLSRLMARNPAKRVVRLLRQSPTPETLRPRAFPACASTQTDPSFAASLLGGMDHCHGEMVCLLPSPRRRPGSTFVTEVARG
jgi:hypothetical protein